MTLEDLEKEHDEFVRQVGAMLVAQQEYFDGKRRGYNEPHKLQRCKRMEAAVAKYVISYNQKKESKQQSLF